MPTTADYLQDLVNQKNALANNIEAAGVSASTSETLNTLVPKVVDVYNKGAQTEYDKFWDIYQNRGNPQTYLSAFSSVRWTDEIYRPKYAIVVSGNANNMFAYNSNITDTKVTIDLSQMTGPNHEGLFRSCNKLVTITKVIVNEITYYTNWFENCTALKNIIFQGLISNNIDLKWSKALTKASIQSIINCLSTTVSSKTLILPLTAINNAFETSAGAANGSTSTEWNSLKSSKSNWTITLDNSI